MVEQIRIRARSAGGIVRELEAAIRQGALEPGSRLPSVRSLANELQVSPMTVVSAYSTLKGRGMLVAERRRGTRVAGGPPVKTPPPAPLPSGVRNLADGNPDPSLLPPLASVVDRVNLAPKLYGERANLHALVELAAKRFEVDGVPAHSLAVFGGAFDAIERLLQAHLGPGDQVAVEDPGFPRVFDLVGALGLLPVPVAIDERGPTPPALERAFAAGAQAAIVTPRAQNPTGAALDEGRAAELRDILAAYPDVLVIEDDYVGPISGTAVFTFASDERECWAVVRSFSKALGPDLRLAVLAGDPVTVARVEGRQLLGTGWVSHILQQLTAALLSGRETKQILRKAKQTYRARRTVLIEALAERGIDARGRSGLNVWVPVPEEARTITSLLERGWAVSAGERFRRESPPAVRITTSTLAPEESRELARDLAAILGPQPYSYAA